MNQALPNDYSALYGTAHDGAIPPLDATRRDLLALAARGAPIGEALNAVVRAVAQVRTQETRAAIFIFDPAGAQLRFAASANLDAGYTSKIDYFPVAAHQPSCGKAAFTGEDEIVGDVAKDPAWAPYLAVAQEHGIAACWSFLLKSPGGRVLGSFALYHRTPSLPNPADFEEVRYFVNIASLMLDRHIEAEQRRAEQEARETALQVASRHKDVFIATLAHELRNPLSAMAYCLALLDLGTGSPDTRARALGSAQRQVGHMRHLIEDLLDTSRLDRGALRLQRVDMALAAALDLAVETVTPMLGDKRQHLTVTLPATPIMLYADASRVTQMVCNILGNAGKYSGIGGQITLRVDVEDAYAVIRVRDDGIGIAPDKLASVFTIFEQLGDVHDPANTGLGIGLNLVRNLAGLHGGSVEAASAGIGMGSEFILRLPTS